VLRKKLIETSDIHYHALLLINFRLKSMYVLAFLIYNLAYLTFQYLIQYVNNFVRKKTA